MKESYSMKGGRVMNDTCTLLYKNNNTKTDKALWGQKVTH